MRAVCYSFSDSKRNSSQNLQPTESISRCTKLCNLCLCWYVFSFFHKESDQNNHYQGYKDNKLINTVVVVRRLFTSISSLSILVTATVTCHDFPFFPNQSLCVSRKLVGRNFIAQSIIKRTWSGFRWSIMSLLAASWWAARRI